MTLPQDDFLESYEESGDYIEDDEDMEKQEITLELTENQMKFLFSTVEMRKLHIETYISPKTSLRNQQRRDKVKWLEDIKSQIVEQINE